MCHLLAKCFAIKHFVRCWYWKIINPVVVTETLHRHVITWVTQGYFWCLFLQEWCFHSGYWDRVRESSWSLASSRHHLLSGAFWSSPPCRYPRSCIPKLITPLNSSEGISTVGNGEGVTVLFLKHGEKTQERFHVITLYKHIYTRFLGGTRV